MQTSVAAVAARPGRARAEQPHAGAVRVVVDGPLRVEEGADVVLGQKLCRAVRPHRHAQFQPLGPVRRRRRIATGLGRASFGKRQHVPSRQCAPVHPADAPQCERRRRPHHRRHVEAAGDEQVGASAPFHLADGEGVAGRHGERFPALCAGHRASSAGCVVETAEAGDAHGGRAVEAQRRAPQRDLQSRRAFGIAEQPVAEAKREVVHGAGRGHADCPVALAAGPGLHRGVQAGGQHFDAGRLVVEGRQRAGVVPRLREGRRGQRLAQIVAVGLHAEGDRLRQGVAQLAPCAVAAWRMGHHLGDEGVVERRNVRARTQPSVHANAGVARKRRHGDGAGRRPKAVVRVFGAQPRLHGAAGGVQLGGQDVERRQFAGREIDHPAHQVDAEDQFGDAVLHLQARVHLKEVRRLGIGVVQELHRAGAAVGHLFQQRLRIAMHSRPNGVREIRRRALLHHLLMAALQRTVAVAEHQHATVAVAEGLYFHMPRRGDAAFHEQPRVAELRLGQALHRREPIHQLRLVLAARHADAAAAGGALEHHRIAELPRPAAGLVGVRQHVAAGQQRHAGGFRQPPRFVLQAEAADVRRPRADERHAALLKGLGEVRVLAQEAVAGMDRIGAALRHCVEQLGLVHVCFGNAAGT